MMEVESYQTVPTNPVGAIINIYTLNYWVVDKGSCDFLASLV